MVLLTNFPPPTEGIRHQQVNTSADIDGKDLGNGTLFISESCVAWQKESDGLGFSLQYPGISCHAICRDLSTFPQECLYLMIDGKLPDANPAEASKNDDEEEAEEDDEDEEELAFTEVRFIPLDKTMLQPMYAAMSACQALHPDPEDVDSEDEFADFNEDDEDGEENGYFDSEEGAAHLTAEGRTNLARFDAILHFGQGDGPCPANGHHHVIAPSGDAGQAVGDLMDMGQFQDADEMD